MSDIISANNPYLTSNQVPPSSTTGSTSGVSIPTGSTSGVTLPTGSSTLVLDETAVREEGSASLLQGVRSNATLSSPPSFSPEELEANMSQIAGTLQASTSELAAVLEPGLAAFQGMVAIFHHPTEAQNTSETPSSSTSSDAATVPDDSGSPSSNGTSSTSSTTSSNTSDAISMTTIEAELAGLDISISNTASAQNTALIDSISSMTSAALAAANDTMASGNALMQGAFASFITTAAFTSMTVGSTLSASKEASETADAETVQQTNTSVTTTDQATLATQKAVSSGKEEDIIAARQANTQAKQANDKLTASSPVKQQNDKTIAANEKALTAKENATHAKSEAVAARTGSAPDDIKADKEDANAAKFQKEGEDALKTAQESQTTSNDLIHGKASLTASKEAVEATEKYTKEPTLANKTAAEEAQKKAEATNAKLSPSSPLRARNDRTLADNKAAIDSTTTAHFETSSDGKLTKRTSPLTNTKGIENLNSAKKSQAEATNLQPRNPYVRSKVFTEGSSLDVYSTAFGKSQILSQLGDQATNVIDASYQAQSKTFEAKGQMQSAYSQVYQQAISSTNQSMQSLYELAAALRSSSTSVAQDMASMVSSTRTA